MNYSTAQKILEAAAEIDHEESRERMRAIVLRTVRPLYDDMVKTVGQYTFELFWTNMPAEYIKDIEGVQINSPGILDLKDLVDIANHLQSLELETAWTKIQRLDTIVRENIPQSIWNFFTNDDT